MIYKDEQNNELKVPRNPPRALLTKHFPFHKRKYINRVFVKRFINEKKTLNLYMEMHTHDKNIDATNVMNSSS